MREWLDPRGVDLDSVVQTRSEKREDDGLVAALNLMWECESYGEYMLKCAIEGAYPLMTEDEYRDFVDTRPPKGRLIDLNNFVL